MILFTAPTVFSAHDLPPPPQKVQIQKEGGSISLNWKMPRKSKFTGFKIYRSEIQGERGIFIAKISKKARTYSDKEADGNKIYFYTINSFNGPFETKALAGRQISTFVPTLIVPTPIVSTPQQEEKLLIRKERAFEDVNVDGKVRKLLKFKKGIFTYYTDPSLFTSEDIENLYFEKRANRDQIAFDFVKSKLGFDPVLPEVIQIDLYYPNRPGEGFASGYTITGRRPNKVTSQSIDTIGNGNTHEFVHFFLKNKLGLGAPTGYFEEGLANYIEHLQENNGERKLRCTEEGWQEGYFDNNNGNNFVSARPAVKYSDFSVSSKSTGKSEDFYSPLNRHSYYNSGECFWFYVVDVYGVDAIKKVGKSWRLALLEKPVNEMKFMKDIVVPAFGADIMRIVERRYNYTEK